MPLSIERFHCTYSSIRQTSIPRRSDRQMRLLTPLRGSSERVVVSNRLWDGVLDRREQPDLPGRAKRVAPWISASPSPPLLVHSTARGICSMYNTAGNMTDSSRKVDLCPRIKHFRLFRCPKIHGASFWTLPCCPNPEQVRII